jgi:hypothetical protein
MYDLTASPEIFASAESKSLLFDEAKSENSINAEYLQQKNTSDASELNSESFISEEKIVFNLEANLIVNDEKSDLTDDACLNDSTVAYPSNTDFFEKSDLDLNNDPIEIPLTLNFSEEPKEDTFVVMNRTSENIIPNESHGVSEKSTSAESEEQISKSRAMDRIARIREMNMRIKSSGGLTDFEKEPAYKRRGIQFEEHNNSGSVEISRLSLSEEVEGRPEIRPNNSFLNDRVD